MRACFVLSEALEKLAILYPQRQADQVGIILLDMATD